MILSGADDLGNRLEGQRGHPSSQHNFGAHAGLRTRAAGQEVFIQWRWLDMVVVGLDAFPAVLSPTTIRSHRWRPVGWESASSTLHGDGRYVGYTLLCIASVAQLDRARAF
jgi:hypothetical protein